jgi:hypothetical protein
MKLKLLAGRLFDACRDYPAVRRAIAAVPAGRPIFLTGTHRSGTTWLAKMLAESGIWYVHEPFSPKKGRRARSFEFREPDVRDPRIDALFSEVLAGGFREALNLRNADHPLMPLRWMPPNFQRVLVKDPLACLLTEYLTRHFGLQSLILFRHPAGFAASVSRLGWPRGAFLRHFLADSALMNAHLEKHRPLLEKYADEESLASAAVLHGSLSSVLWDFVERGVGRALIFEELCSDPLPRLQALFASLDLPYDERVREAHRKACLGEILSPQDYHPHAVVRNSIAMSRSWVNQLDAGQSRHVRDIWEQFEIPLYRAESDWSREEIVAEAEAGAGP